MNITIIFLEDSMLISKVEYKSWREIQDEYEGYKASLGPWDADDVVEYLEDEYTDLNPEAKIQVENLLSASEKTRRLTFNA
ncbi:hypothetical protein ACFOEK_20105 [Litoribrevibacter euphylliae]|uniref:Uncharacterized protein n=1 Tax=Litoribrevibacter euphylliae TaxID=1834034 RepID=A0ABV7HKS8_9GAMM